MDGIIFLTLDEVLQIQIEEIARFGGEEGIHDVRLIESAIAQPGMSFGGSYLHADIAAMAAAYLFHLSKNHGFKDGNKRTGTVAALVFLAINEVQIIEFPEGELAKLTNDVVTGAVSKEQAAEMIRQRILN